jgi:hypothetical protein
METCRVLEKVRRQIRDTGPRRWPLHRWPLHRWPLHRWPLHRWPLHRWPLHRWPLHRWPLLRWPLHRWPLHRWPLHRWPLHRWPLHRIGSAPTVYRLRPYGVSAPPLRTALPTEGGAAVAYGRRCSGCLRKAVTPLPTEGGAPVAYGKRRSGARRSLRKADLAEETVGRGKAELA